MLDTVQDDRLVTFTSSGVVVSGSFRAPVALETSVGAAVLVAGSGPVDRDENVPGRPDLRLDCLRWLADRCSQAGVATLRYDKFGVGATGPAPFGSPELSAWDFDQAYVQPVRDALSFLAGQPGIDADRLMVIGHSEGGGIALAVGFEPGSGPAPRRLALLEPLYERSLDAVARQLSDHVHQAALGPEVTEAFLTCIRDEVTSIRSDPPGPDPQAGPPRPVPPLPDASGRVAELQEMLLDRLARFGNRSAQTEDRIDPLALAANIKVPTLLTVGTKDFNTPRVEAGGAGVDQLAAAFPPGVVDYVVVDEMHHTLRDLRGADMMLPLPEVIGMPFSMRLAAALSDFLAPWAPA